MENLNNKLSIFGSSGFIGSRFCELYPDLVSRVERQNNHPQYNNVLYLISTTDNYGPVEGDLFRDIETNLIKLMKVLENCKDRPGFVINFISSFFVYGAGKPKGAHTNEEDECKPLGFYSSTKYCGENLLASYCRTFNINYRILGIS